MEKICKPILECLRIEKFVKHKAFPDYIMKQIKIPRGYGKTTKIIEEQLRLLFEVTKDENR